MRLGCPFTDLDDLVRARLGVPSLASIIRTVGEPAFRVAERDALAEYLAATAPPAVLALGGGTPTHPESRRLIEDARSHGLARMLLLDAEPAVLGARVAAAPGDRPLLVGASFLEEAALLGERRLPLYRTLADRVIRTDRPTAETLEELAAAAEAA